MSNVTPGSSPPSGIPVNDIVRQGGNNPEQEHGIQGSFLGEYYIRLAIGPYIRPKPFAHPDWNPNTVVFLPLPTVLRDSTPVDYQTTNLETVGDFVNGASGATAAGMLRSSGQMITGIGGFASKGAQELAGTARNTGAKMGADLIGGISGIVGNLLNAEQFTSAIQQNLGVAPNPNPSVSFQGPKLRTFSYDWNIYPRNAEESRAVQRLIKVLKMKTLPRVAVENSAAVLEYPDMCQINFYPWDRNGGGDWGWSDNSIIKHKKCVMTSVNVAYNSQGVASFFEDTQLPVAYSLSIEFQEIEYMLADDWKDASVPDSMITKRVNGQGIDKYVNNGIYSGGYIAGIAGVELGAGTIASGLDASAGILTGASVGVGIDALLAATGNL